jgi:probable phosphomutase (TIGR03848 family)
MPLFLLIRHGENDYVKKGRLAGRLPGVHLNENGCKQALTLAEKLAEAPIKAIYSSPLERALETARPLASAKGLEVTILPGLNEIEVGEWQDQKLRSLSRQKIWRVVQMAPSRFQFPKGEAFAAAQVRICQELETLAKQHDSKDLVVCFSHSDPIKLAVAYYAGMPLDMFQRLSISTASITALYLGEMGTRLLTMNYEFSFTLPKA